MSPHQFTKLCTVTRPCGCQVARTAPSPGPFLKASACLPPQPWPKTLSTSSVAALRLVPNSTHPKPPEEGYNNHASWRCGASPPPSPWTAPSQPQVLFYSKPKSIEWGQHSSPSNDVTGRRTETAGQAEQQPPGSAFCEWCLGQTSTHTTGLVHSPTVTPGGWQLPGLLRHAIPGDLPRTWALNTMHSG